MSADNDSLSAPAFIDSLHLLYRYTYTALKMELTRKTTNSQRLPPPVLFQGPPSHNASNISLSVPPATSALPTPSGSQPPPLQRNRLPIKNEGENAEKASLLSPFMSRRQSKHDVDGSDA